MKINTIVFDFDTLNYEFANSPALDENRKKNVNTKRVQIKKKMCNVIFEDK
jgi:hypothetical protein